MELTSRDSLQKMVATSVDGSSYDRMSELKAFDDTKTGVQGLIENGVTNVPRIFYNDQANQSDGSASESNPKFNIPIIDLSGIHDDSIQRDDVVGKIRHACEKWGFFQVTNHGIPTEVMDEMIKGTRRFHEQDASVRKEYYTRDFTRKVAYVSNFSLYKDPYVDWRDSLAFFKAPHPSKPEELPPINRDIVIEYTKKVMTLSSTLFELLSEALGLNSSHLKEMGCAEGLLLVCHYYPACPEPELTMGTSKHTDPNFMTILLQDQMGGLQILHENQWIDVPPMHGAFIVNIGDLLQLVTNDRFKSVEHRVLAKHVGPRISVASLFRTHNHPGEETSKVFGPIKELLSEKSPPIYRDVPLKEYLTHCYSKGITSSVSDFKL